MVTDKRGLGRQWRHSCHRSCSVGGWRNRSIDGRRRERKETTASRIKEKCTNGEKRVEYEEKGGVGIELVSEKLLFGANGWGVIVDDFIFLHEPRLG